MSNQLIANPLLVDTLSNTALFTGKMYVDHINYVGWTDSSHVARVTDANGNEMALLSGDTIPSTYHNGHWVTGILVPTTLADNVTANMPSGHLLIYLK